MPFQKTYTDSGGVTHASAYWVIGSINPNLINKTGSFSVHIYDSQSVFASDPSMVLPDTPLLFAVNDPSVFDEVFGEALLIGGSKALATACEDYIKNGDVGGRNALGVPFTPSNATPIQYTPIYVVSAEAGLNGPDVVTVIFSDEISTSTDYLDGVHINIGGISASISSAAIQPGNKEIRYTMASQVVGYALQVTWVYVPSSGHLTDSNGLSLASIDATVTNNIGVIRDFRQNGNIQLALVL